MLQDDFFKMISMDTEASSIQVMLELNADHNIFKGHFPGMPVVPGVCMMQMVHEIMEKVTGKSLLLTKADQMKFLVVIDPLEHRILKIELNRHELEDGSFKVSAILSIHATVCFKFKGIFTVVG